MRRRRIPSASFVITSTPVDSAPPHRGTRSMPTTPSRNRVRHHLDHTRFLRKEVGMAVIYVCDRCGAHTAPDGLTQAELSLPPDPDISLDLCGDCATQVREHL